MRLFFLLTALVHISMAGAAPHSSSRCSRSFWTGAQHVEQRLSSNDFQTSRNFEMYEEHLSAPGIPPLREFLSQLGASETWLDSGAGSALALRAVLNNPAEYRVKNINHVALAYARPVNMALSDQLREHADRFQYIDGGFVENLVRDRNSDLWALRGRVSLLTEIFGPLSYSQNPSRIFAAYADLLKVGGQALIYFPEGSTKLRWTNPHGVQHRLTLRELSFLIPQMTGGRLRVRSARMGRTLAGASEFDYTVFWLEKVANRSRGVISPLHLTKFEDEAPPKREYNVLVPEGVEMDPVRLRQEDLRREQAEGIRVIIPRGY